MGSREGSFHLQENVPLSPTFFSASDEGEEMRTGRWTFTAELLSQKVKLSSWKAQLSIFYI